jgi:hypothetical protein
MSILYPAYMVIVQITAGMCGGFNIEFVRVGIAGRMGALRVTIYG